MTFTLILVGVYFGMQVGTFATMDECKRAATAAQTVAPPKIVLLPHGYICVQSK